MRKYIRLIITGLVWVVGMNFFLDSAESDLIVNSFIFRRIRGLTFSSDIINYFDKIQEIISGINQEQPRLSIPERIKIIQDAFKTDGNISLEEDLYQSLRFNVGGRSLVISVITSKIVHPKEEIKVPLEEVLKDLLKGEIIVYDKEGKEISRYIKSEGMPEKDYSALKDGYIRTTLSPGGALTLGRNIIYQFRQKDYGNFPVELKKENGFITHIFVYNQEGIILEEVEYNLIYKDEDLIFSKSRLSEEDLMEFLDEDIMVRKRIYREGDLSFGSKYIACSLLPFALVDTHYKQGRIDKIIIYDDFKAVFEERRYIYSDGHVLGIDIYDSQGELKDKIEYLLIYKDGRLIETAKKLTSKRLRELDQVEIVKRTDSQGTLSFGESHWWQDLPENKITKSYIIQGKVVETKVYDEEGRLIDTREMILEYDAQKRVLIEVHYYLTEEEFSKIDKRIIVKRLDKNGHLNIAGKSPFYIFPPKYANFICQFFVEDGLMKKTWILDSQDIVMEERHFRYEDRFISQVKVYEDKKLIDVIKYRFVYEGGKVKIEDNHFIYEEANTIGSWINIPSEVISQLKYGVVRLYLDKDGALSLGGNYITQFSRFPNYLSYVEIKEGRPVYIWVVDENSRIIAQGSLI